MNNGNGTVHGKRKLFASMSYIVCAFASCTILVCVDKITGAEFVQGIQSAAYVVVALLGANVVKAGIEKIGGK